MAWCRWFLKVNLFIEYSSLAWMCDLRCSFLKLSHPINHWNIYCPVNFNIQIALLFLYLIFVLFLLLSGMVQTVEIWAVLLSERSFEFDSISSTDSMSLWIINVEMIVKYCNLSSVHLSETKSIFWKWFSGKMGRTVFWFFFLFFFSFLSLQNRLNSRVKVGSVTVYIFTLSLHQC